MHRDAQVRLFLSAVGLLRLRCVHMHVPRHSNCKRLTGATRTVQHSSELVHAQSNLHFRSKKRTVQNVHALLYHACLRAHVHASAESMRRPLRTCADVGCTWTVPHTTSDDSQLACACGYRCLGACARHGVPTSMCGGDAGLVHRGAQGQTGVHAYACQLVGLESCARCLVLSAHAAAAVEWPLAAQPCCAVLRRCLPSRISIVAGVL